MSECIDLYSTLLLRAPNALDIVISYEQQVVQPVVQPVVRMSILYSRLYNQLDETFLDIYIINK